MEASEIDEDKIWETCCNFLLTESASGSDAGLCLAKWDTVPVQVCKFGQRAKLEVLTQAEAARIAKEQGLRLQGLTGTHGGIIGALAGVGLHRGGSDGRFLWLPGLRELSGKLTVSEICSRGSIDGVCPLAGDNLPMPTVVEVGTWVRPILFNHQAILYVEEFNHEWRILPKDQIKSLSN